MHLAWVEKDVGRYQGQMGVYVKPRDRFAGASPSFRRSCIRGSPRTLTTSRFASMAAGHSAEQTSNAATKWRCPTGECQPKSKWIKANRRNPLIPRGSSRWGDLYGGRAAVEREFGRLKHEYGLTPLRIRGLRRVRLHADLVMLARLSQALTRVRELPLAA